MTALQKLQLRQSEIRQRLNGLGASEELTEDESQEIDKLTTEYQDGESRARALMVAEDSDPEPVADSPPDSEERELEALEARAQITTYMLAALEMRAVDGAELELNQALGIAPNQVPVSLFASEESEDRTMTDAVTTYRQRRWLDRLMAGTAAESLGLTMEQVPGGEALFPQTLTGGVPAQRGREQAAAVGAWTIGVTSFKPTRMSLHYNFTIEDNARIPGLEDALRRDMRNALRERLDYTIFRGDDTADPNTGDITGFFGSAAVETEIVQADKVKWPETVAKFTAMIDGLHAESLGDMNIVSSVGAQRLWLSTQANTNRNESLAQIMMGNGLSWRTRHGIATTTANNDFMAAIGLARGIRGAAVVCMWPGAELIRDPYSGAAKGQVQLTMHTLWNWGLVRAANFKRLKAVT